MLQVPDNGVLVLGAEGGIYPGVEEFIEITVFIVRKENESRR
jgi:hypothetical protein